MKKHVSVCTVILGLLLVLACAFGCASFKADVAKVETKIQGIDYSQVAAWYDKATVGLDNAARVAAVFIPQYSLEIAAADEAIDISRAGVDMLTALAKNARAGSASAADLVSAADKLDTDYKAAASAVGSLLSKGSAPVPAS
jgi:hypothetical protein